MSFLRSRLPTLFHPASGALILGIDWLLFSGGVLTLGVSTPVLLVLGGLATTIAVAGIQSRYRSDGRGRSILKGVFGGIAVGVPLPIAGTGLGGLILALSGLNTLLTDGGSSDGGSSPSASSSPSDHDR